MAGRAALYVCSLLFVALGAVMLTQAAYDPESADVSFRAFALAVMAGGAATGAGLVKKE